jgi:hypothetical protein
MVTAVASFDNGISSYVHATATVDVYFPVDERGNSHVTCRHCYYYRDASHRCGLNYEICSFPDKYVGDNCPLEPDTDENGEIINSNNN